MRRRCIPQYITDCAFAFSSTKKWAAAWPCTRQRSSSTPCPPSAETPTAPPSPCPAPWKSACTSLWPSSSSSSRTHGMEVRCLPVFQSLDTHPNQLLTTHANHVAGLAHFTSAEFYMAHVWGVLAAEAMRATVYRLATEMLLPRDEKEE